MNLEPVTHDISKRTLERYINLFEEDDLAKTTMDKITTTLVEVLGTKIDKQRLDSTRIFSDMASFGRTRLMGVAIKRFLTQLKRHSKTDYNSLDESLRNHYAPGVNQLFAETRKDSESRHLFRQQVAEDMYLYSGLLIKANIVIVILIKQLNEYSMSNAMCTKTRSSLNKRPAAM